MKNLSLVLNDSTSQTPLVKPRHAALAVAVAAVWGVAFVMIEVGLRSFPPLLFSCLRFAVAAVPALLFLGGPRVAWRWVFAVGLVLGVAKFGLEFTSMSTGMPAGLSSLVLQCQVIFTVLIATVVLRERPRPAQVGGIAVAAVGIALIAVDHGLHGPFTAFGLMIAAGACWGLSNVITRYASPPDALRFVVWVSAVAVLPLLALSLLVEGPGAIVVALSSLSWTGASAVAYVAWGATLFGFGAWGFLLRTYDTGTVAPFSLLVPVTGMLSAWLVLGEALTPLRCAAGALIVAGTAATVLTPRAAHRVAAPAAPEAHPVPAA